MDDEITQVRDALEAAGLHTWELTEGIVNVYSIPLPPDGPTPDHEAEGYLFTVTVTKTP